MHLGDPSFPVMSPYAYQEYIARPRVRSLPYGGGEAFYAAASVDQDNSEAMMASESSSGGDRSDNEEQQFTNEMDEH
jgi:hypothetical protein